MNTNTTENKMRTPVRENKGGESCDVTITEITSTGAVAVINNLPAHTVQIPAALFAGRDLHVGDVVTVEAQRPEWFGFRNRPREQWTATAILSDERTER